MTFQAVSRFLVMGVVLVFSFCVTSVSNAEEARKPNIIYILMDDAGYGDLGCFGQETLATPNIDRMADEGMRFTQHYAGCTVCAPSRCVLLTGKHTGHCSVRGNSPGLMQEGEPTIASVLKEAGYRTGVIGKWGIGNPPPLDDPARFGFDYAYGYVSMWHAHNFYPEFLIRNGEKVALRNVVEEKWQGSDGRGIAVEKVDYVPQLLSDDVIAFIERNQDQPFFLYYALNIPHANNEAGAAKTPERGMEVQVSGFGEFADEDWPGPEKGFAQIMKNIDSDVGRIIAKLKELGLDEDTLVILTSDNGPHQEGGHQMEFFDSNGSLRGMKRDLYEGGIREPTVMRWPGKIPAGATSDHISAFQDMLPTFADIAGVETPQGVDGISMLPAMLGREEEQSEHEYLYWEFTEQGGKRAIRQGDWKLVQLNMSRPEPSSPELYNIADDPSETTDVAADHPEIVARLVELMDAAHEPSDMYPLTAGERKGRQ